MVPTDDDMSRTLSNFSNLILVNKILFSSSTETGCCVKAVSIFTIDAFGEGIKASAIEEEGMLLLIMIVVRAKAAILLEGRVCELVFTSLFLFVVVKAGL